MAFWFVFLNKLMPFLLCVKCQRIEASCEIAVVTGILQKILKACVQSRRIQGLWVTCHGTAVKTQDLLWMAIAGIAEPSTFLLAGCPMVGDGPLQHPDLPSATHAGNPAPGPLHGSDPSVLGCWEVVGTAGELMGPLKKKKESKRLAFSPFSPGFLRLLLKSQRLSPGLNGARAPSSGSTVASHEDLLLHYLF